MSFFGGAMRQPFMRVVESSEQPTPKPSVYEHIDPETGRCFHLTIASRHTDEGSSTRFFVTEFCPSGQIVSAEDDVCDEPLLLELELGSGPNQFLSAAEAHGFPVDRIVMVAMGAQMAPGFESIDAALDVITYCILSNRRYSLFDPLEHREAALLAQDRSTDSPSPDLMIQIRQWADRTS